MGLWDPGCSVWLPLTLSGSDPSMGMEPKVLDPLLRWGPLGRTPGVGAQQAGLILLKTEATSGAAGVWRGSSSCPPGGKQQIEGFGTGPLQVGDSSPSEVKTGKLAQVLKGRWWRGEKVLRFVTSLENPTSGPTFEEGRGAFSSPH